MPTPTAPIRHSGRDTVPQFTVFFLLFGGGCIPIPFWVHDGFGVYGVVAVFAAAALVAAGLRFSILVSSESVVIQRSWFGVPYWRDTGQAIKEIYFGGDYGDSEGASGVIVVLDGGREFHIGSGKSMHELYEALQPFKARQP